MSETENEQVVGEVSGSNPYWDELKLWLVIYFSASLLPCVLLALFWLRYKPSLGVFTILAGTYLVATIILLLPLLGFLSKDKNKQ